MSGWGVMLIKCLALCCLVSVANANEITGRVERVSDGDTFVLVTSEGVPHRIRMLHIDSPERGKHYYKKSKLMLKALINEKIVTNKCTWIDGFNRHLCETFVDGKYANKSMIEQGGAWLSVKYYNRKKDKAKLVAIEKLARDNSAGLWGISEYRVVMPWKFKK